MSKLAVLGGEPVRRKPWMSWPDFREADVQAVASVVASGKWWQYDGEEVNHIEQEFAAYQDAAHGVAVNSGTTALVVALQALGIGPGDEVIVPAYTFQATAASVVMANAVPVFVDVAPETSNMDPEAAAAAITPRTRAIIPVHIAGLPANMERILALAKTHGLKVLEDAAQAHGAVWRGRKVGSIGDAGAFSFQASKNLCSGEGGMITTNDEEVAAAAAGLRDCGRAAGRPFYEHHRIGYNFRLTEMQGALLRSRLRLLEEETERRFHNGRLLTERLSQVPSIEPLDPEPQRGDRRAYHLYPVRVVDEALGGIGRDRFLEALNAEGVPASAGYGQPLYRNPVYLEGRFNPHGCPISCGYYGGSVDYSSVSCPNTERLCREAVWLSHRCLLGDERDMEDISRAFEKIVENRGELARGAKSRRVEESKRRRNG